MMNVRTRRVKSLMVGLLMAVGGALLISPQAMAEDEKDDFNRAGPYIGARILGGSFGRYDDRLVSRIRGLEASINAANDVINAADPTAPSIPRLIPEDVDHDPQLGFDIYAGYRLHKNIAVEGEFEMVLPGKIRGTSGTLVEFEAWVLSGAVKAILPVGRFQPYVTVGVGYMEVDVKDKRPRDPETGMAPPGPGFGDNDGGVVGRAGGGIDYYLTNHIVANLAIDYIIPSSDLGDYDYLSFGAGIQYRF